MDEPFPENLPHVPACKGCNEGFSRDEEYVACLVECVLKGTTDPAKLARPKVARLLTAKPALAARIASAMKQEEETIMTRVEYDRVRNVVMKLACGHAFYEQHVMQEEEPSSLWFGPLILLDEQQRISFEQAPTSSAWPEVGSRALQRMVENGESDGWIVAQPGRYRYLTATAGGIVVRGVLSEYLGFEVVFEA